MNKTIILVEDDESFSEALRINLEYEGYTVISLSNGKTLKAHIQQNFPALIIIDYRLPGKNGSKLIKEIKSQAATKNVPVFLMSANQKNMQQLAKDVGAEIFLGKPFEIDEFISQVNRYTAKEVN